MSLRRIAREVGCAVDTVRSHLAAPGGPRFERKVTRASTLAPFEGHLPERQGAAHPQWIPAAVQMREIVAQDHTGGSSQLHLFMHTVRPVAPGAIR